MEGPLDVAWLHRNEDPTCRGPVQQEEEVVDVQGEEQERKRPQVGEKNLVETTGETCLHARSGYICSFQCSSGSGP